MKALNTEQAGGEGKGEEGKGRSRDVQNHVVRGSRI